MTYLEFWCSSTLIDPLRILTPINAGYSLAPSRTDQRSVSALRFAKAQATGAACAAKLHYIEVDQFIGRSSHPADDRGGPEIRIGHGILLSDQHVALGHVEIHRKRTQR